MRDRKPSILDTVKPGGSLVQVLKPVELRQTLQEDQQRAEQQLAEHRQKLAQLEVQFQQAKLKGTPAKSLRQQLDEIRIRIKRMETVVTGLKKDTQTALDHPALQEKSLKDISIRVGHLAYASVKGPIPIYAIIECVFPHVIHPKLPEQLMLTWHDRRYSVHERDKSATPIAVCDDPVSEDQHDIFQRLYKHWGFWCLRLIGSNRQWDFQIYPLRSKRNVFGLKNSLEASLHSLQMDRETLIAAVSATDVPDVSNSLTRLVVTTEIADKFEALVGTLPLAPAGPTVETGKLRAWVIQKKPGLSPAGAWAQFDVATFEEQLKECIGGKFLSVIWSNARPGVDLAQLMAADHDNYPSAIDVWLRAVPTVRGHMVGRTQLPGVDLALPMEEFTPNGYTGLEEEDISRIWTWYTKHPASPSITATDSREVTREVHEAIVANYLRICQSVRSAASGGELEAQRVWPYLRDTVIFELPSVAYTLLQDGFAASCADLARVKAPTGQRTPKQNRRIVEVIHEGGAASLPDNLPFQSCFFAYGGGVKDSHYAPEEATTTVQQLLYGHLVTAAGWVVNFRRDDDGRAVFSFDRDPTVDGHWTPDRLHTLAPWIINALIEYVNEHKTLIEQGKNGFGYQALLKKAAKRLNMKVPIPPPFYVVYMKDTVVQEHVRRRASVLKRHIDWQHRWRVRGHGCIRLFRGLLPLDPEFEEVLKQRKYKIFKETPPDGEIAVELAKRGVSNKRGDEWLAVLQYWREDSIKGPSDKPLVESVRRSTKKWTV